jgi:hypothetical protein
MSKNLAKIPVHLAKILDKNFDKNPIKIWWDKNFYIFLNIQTKTKHYAKNLNDLVINKPSKKPRNKPNHIYIYGFSW